MAGSAQYASQRGIVCYICDELIPLEISKTDARGKGVHEECYVRETISRFRTAHGRSSTLQVCRFVEGGTMESRHAEELRIVTQLLHKQTEVLESKILGKATDPEIFEYEIRQELIDQLCEHLAHSSATQNTS